MRPHRRAARPRRHRGFTLLEMVAALALASIVIAAAGGMFLLLASTESRSADRFDDSLEMTITHDVLQRAMQSLIAGAPRAEDLAELEEAGASDEDGDGGEEEGAPSTGALINDLVEDADGLDGEAGGDDEEEGEARSWIQVLAEDLADEPGNEWLIDLLTLGELIDSNHFDLFVDQTDDGIVPRLEVVLAEPPMPMPVATEDDRISALAARLRGSVRGAFALALLEDGWALQWEPILPPGDPTVLVRGLVSLEWRVLPEDIEEREWTDVFAAYLAQDFPVAVQLMMVTRDGVMVDWVFETSMTTPGAAPGL